MRKTIGAALLMSLMILSAWRFSADVRHSALRFAAGLLLAPITNGTPLSQSSFRDTAPVAPKSEEGMKPVAVAPHVEKDDAELALDTATTLADVAHDAPGVVPQQHQVVMKRCTLAPPPADHTESRRRV